MKKILFTLLLALISYVASAQIKSEVEFITNIGDTSFIRTKTINVTNLNVSIPNKGKETKVIKTWQIYLVVEKQLIKKFNVYILDDGTQLTVESLEKASTYNKTARKND